MRMNGMISPAGSGSQAARAHVVPVTLVDAMRAIAALRAEVAQLRRAVEAQAGKAPLSGHDMGGVMAGICADVAQRYDVTVAELRGTGRARVVSWARQEAFARCQDAGKSLPQIGRFFGGRHHKTVLEGAQRHRARAEKLERRQ